MGLFDFLPWKKKEESAPLQEGSSFDAGSIGSQDPFSGSSQSQDPFSSPSQDPFGGSSGAQDPLGAQRDPFGDSSQHDPQDPFSSQQSPPNFSPPQQQRAPQRSFERPSSQDAPAQPSSYEVPPSRDMELVLAKLDAIKAELDSVHQRVRSLEGGRQSQQRRYNW